jgi:hypothetical protein
VAVSPVTIKNDSRWPIMVGEIRIPAAVVEPGKFGKSGSVEVARDLFEKHAKQLKAWASKGALTLIGA